MAKFFDKVKSTLFPSHDPNENQVVNLNNAAKIEAGVTPTQPTDTPAPINQAEAGMQSARANLEAHNKSPENLQMDERAVPKHDANADKEIAQPQVDYSEDEANEMKTEAQSNNLVMQALQTKEPENAKEALIDYCVSKGLAKIDKNGNIKYNTTAKSISSQIGNVLSALLTVATAGAIPPINFYRISGAEGEDEARKKAFSTLMDNIADSTGKALGLEETANVDKEVAKAAGDTNFWSSGEGAQMEQQLNNTLAQMAASNNNQKILIDFMAKTEANKVPYLISALNRAGISNNQLRELIRANSGQLPAWAEYIKLGTDIVGAIK